jgi:hypothetical protein
MTSSSARPTASHRGSLARASQESSSELLLHLVWFPSYTERASGIYKQSRSVAVTGCLRSLDCGSVCSAEHSQSQYRFSGWDGRQGQTSRSGHRWQLRFCSTTESCVFCHLLSIHHRHVRGVCSIGAIIHDSGSICGCRWYDHRRYVASLRDRILRVCTDRLTGLPFYQNMGVAYTLTIMGCISALLVPVPYLFYIYGPWIRSKSKFAANRS